MIGQQTLLKRIDDLIASNKLPRFMILVGQHGSGRKMVANYIAKHSNHQLIMVEPNADGIREMIAQAYKVIMPTAYVIADADTMSNAAKNAMLKVTEEPPNNACFIMTLQDEYQTLDTIRSRGTIFHMNTYTTKEIAMCVGGDDMEYIAEFTNVCDTPYEVILLKRYGVSDFNDFVRLVVDNIAIVSGANAFKIADRLAFDDNSGYDLHLFWKAFMRECIRRFQENPKMYGSGVSITSKYLQQLNTQSINKPNTFDMWLLDIRKEWIRADD